MVKGRSFWRLQQICPIKSVDLSRSLKCQLLARGFVANSVSRQEHDRRRGAEVSLLLVEEAASRG